MKTQTQHTKWRIIDNNGQWSNWHKTKKEALAELKRQREYDNAHYSYGLQVFDGEWITIEFYE